MYVHRCADSPFEVPRKWLVYTCQTCCVVYGNIRAHTRIQNLLRKTTPPILVEEMATRWKNKLLTRQIIFDTVNTHSAPRLKGASPERRAESKFVGSRSRVAPRSTSCIPIGIVHCVGRVVVVVTEGFSGLDSGATLEQVSASALDSANTFWCLL